MNLNETEKMLQELYSFCKKELGFKRGISALNFIQSEANAKKLLGKTANYDPETEEINIYVTGRHHKDIARSFAHEICHHWQNEEKRLPLSGLNSQSYAQDDPQLRKAEEEAYLRGNMLFRDWEDSQKKALVEIILRERGRLQLNEGGAAGHMNHLYDDPLLTFKKIKEILIAASSGKIEGTEKVDGVNLFVSFDLQKNVAVGARNKGELEGGGLTAEDFFEKFAEHSNQNLKTVVSNALKSFEELAISLTPQEKIQFFGEYPKKLFYNSDIVSPEASNVVDYNKKFIILHRNGHIVSDILAKTVSDVNLENNVLELTKKVDELGKTKIKDYDMKISALRNLKALSDRKPLEIALKRIEDILHDSGASESSTVSNFLFLRLTPAVEEYISDLSQSKKEQIIRRIAGEKINLRELKKDLNPRQLSQANELLSRANDLRKRAILPLEKTIHDFSVEILKSLDSLFVLDDKKELARIREKVSQAIEKIQNSGNVEAIKQLRRQMEKLESLENISSATEGFVFSFDGKTYKFTGNFAPVNQILGLFKYGRGSLSPMVLEEVKGKINYVLIPGAFKPPHRGHLHMLKQYAEIADKVVVFISNRPREAPGGRAVGADVAVTLFKKYIQVSGLEQKVEIKIADAVSPIVSMLEFISSLPKNTNVVLGTSGKGEDSKRFENFEKYAPEGVKLLYGKDWSVDPLREKNMAFSSTLMRKAIANGDENSFASFLPDELKTDSEELLKIVADMTKTEILEFSGMAMGAVTGALSGSSVEKDEENTKNMLIREVMEYFNSRILNEN